MRTKVYINSKIFGIGTKRLLREVFMDVQQDYMTFKRFKELKIHSLDSMCRRGLIESYDYPFGNKKFVEVIFNYEEKNKEEV